MGRRLLRSSEPIQPPKLHKERRKDKQKGRKKKRRDRSKENQGVNNVFVRQMKQDGTTSLAILAPGDDIVPGTEKDRPIALGNLLGRVRVGTSYLYGFREDKRNIVKAMYPINYNFFSSYGPSYDSTFSNLTLEESQLVQTGDKFRANQTKQYADLIRNVCLEDYTHTFVDHMIDILEGKEVPEPGDQEEPELPDLDQIDFEALQSLSEDGIDMSFLGNLQAEYEKQAEPANLEERLERTAELLQSLRSSQNLRLSSCPTSNLNQVAGPSETELQLASRVLDNLSCLLHSAQPAQVVSVPAIRRAMGVNLAVGETGA